jgi:cytoskeletal protein CcmA (bactofilin family)
MSAKEAPLVALLGRGATYGGDLRFEGRVRIDGTFKGRVYTEDVLEIGEGGLVDGEIDAATLVVSGTAAGRIHARDRLVLAATGALRGTVDAGSIEVAPGARIDATLKVGA